MATTVGTVPVIIDSTVLVNAWSVGIEVTPGAIRLIQRRLPVHRLGVTLVTLGTVEIAPVIQRLVDQAEMPVDMG